MNHDDITRLANSQSVITFRHPATRRGWVWALVLIAFAVLMIWAASGCQRADMHYVNDTYQCAGVKTGCFEAQP
jgi:hypothetical protein